MMDEVGNQWLGSSSDAAKVRQLLVAVLKHRLGVGGLPSVSPKDAQLQGEALIELMAKDDPVGLEALCRQLCGNRSRDHLTLVRAGFEDKGGQTWLDANGECRVLSRMRGDPLLHTALSLLFNEPSVHWVSRLHRTFNSQGRDGKATASLKASWKLEGGLTTETLTDLVTVCKDGELGRVNEILDLPPFNMSLGTLVLGVPDSETRKLLSLIVETALKDSTSNGTQAASPSP